ncbi:hypothetical protein BVG79_00006 [Ketogulonicigenium robustum]|uniref:Uncharacterized protein n=1 Tax=Ketogulonicigenium robustum TaxID=92947 RepID=A0A1W6NVU5_9RHOB|nr:hypothetical protein [Ketogulonicigenium robustum]ARO13368.1 hypothetical protein BVG79_00006 [Ketogulonicigenium robustum]
MIRKELCAIVGMTIPTFNSHRRNGDLPFKIDNSEGKDAAGRIWSNFTIHHAAKMLAARNLCDAHNITWAEAAKIMREPSTACGPYGVGHSYFEKDNIFIAQVEFANSRTNEDPQFMPRITLYKGLLQDIMESANSRAIAYTNSRKEGRAPQDEDICISSISAVNLSHNYKLAKKIAEHLGIDLQENDYALDPNGIE